MTDEDITYCHLCGLELVQSGKRYFYQFDQDTVIRFDIEAEAVNVHTDEKTKACLCGNCRDAIFTNTLNGG